MKKRRRMKFEIWRGISRSAGVIGLLFVVVLSLFQRIALIACILQYCPLRNHTIMKLITCLLFWNCVLKVLAETRRGHHNPDGAMSIMTLHHRRQLQSAPNETTSLFPFRRFLVNVRGASSNNMACPPPEPSISIQCGANLRLVDVDNTTVCTTNNSTDSDMFLDCTGTGRILVDCQATDYELVDFLENLASLTVQVKTPPTPFSCAPQGFVGQGIFLGVVCDDNSVDYAQIACNPQDLLVVPETSEPLCLQQCFETTCTNTDLVPFDAEIDASSDMCYWDLSTSNSSNMSLAPSNAPFASLAPTLSLMATTTNGAPSVSAVPSGTPTMEESEVETSSPTFLLVTRRSSGATMKSARRVFALLLAPAVVVLLAVLW